MDKNQNIVPANMQQTLDGSIKSVTSGSKLSMLQESKEKLNKRIEETLNEITQKEDRIKKLEDDIQGMQLRFRGNQNIRGPLLYKDENGRFMNNNRVNRNLDTLASKWGSEDLNEIHEFISQREKQLEAEGKFDEDLVEDRSKLKVLFSLQKENNSDLERHEKELFKLKECERESNK